MNQKKKQNCFPNKSVKLKVFEIIIILLKWHEYPTKTGC